MKGVPRWLPLAVLAVSIAALVVVGGVILSERSGTPPETADLGKLDSDGETSRAIGSSPTTPAGFLDDPLLLRPADGTPGSDETRILGRLLGIDDKSGGSWVQLEIEIDPWEFLTGDDALAYLTSHGEQDRYAPEYWYARDAAGSRTVYPMPSGATGVEVVMYSWPIRPDPGFYGPEMAPQYPGFGYFYDRVYMYDDEDHLLDRLYWFTVRDGNVVRIEEQPLDPFYEP